MGHPELLVVVEAADGIGIRRMAVELFRVLAEHPLPPLTRPYPLTLRTLADGRGWVGGQFSERQIFVAIEPDGRAGQLVPAVPGRGVLDPASGHIHGNGSLTVLEPVREAPEGQTRLHAWKLAGGWTTELLPMEVTDVSFAASSQTWFVGSRRPPAGAAPNSVPKPAVWVRDSDGQPASPLPFTLDTASRARGALSNWLRDWPEVESFQRVCAECEPPLLVADTPDLFESSFSWIYRPVGQGRWHAYPIPCGCVMPVPIPDGLVVFAGEHILLGGQNLKPRDPMPGLRRALARERPNLISARLWMVTGDTLDGRSLAVIMGWEEPDAGSALAVSLDGGDTWKAITWANRDLRLHDVAWIRP